jgi:hypothetical protein
MGQPVARHSLTTLVPAPWSGAGLHLACYLLAHSGRPESCSGRANYMSVSARRHHLAPRPMVTLAGTKPAPVACRSFVGGYPTLNAHTRPVLGLTRVCPLDTFAQAPPRATCSSPLLPRADHLSISPKCRVLGMPRCSRTENQLSRTAKPQVWTVGGIEPPTSPLLDSCAPRHCLAELEFVAWPRGSRLVCLRLLGPGLCTDIAGVPAD